MHWSNVLVIVVTVGAGLFPPNEVVGQDPPGVQETTGRVVKCLESSDDVTLEVATSAGIQRIVAANAAIPWPSDYYRQLVKTMYRRDGTCPGSNENVRITSCRNCQSPVLVGIEVGGRDAASPATERRLWVVRQFFDLQERHDADRVHLFLASMLLARYNRLDGGSRYLWVRDRLGASLQWYATKERAKAIVDRYGRPDLTRTVEPVCRTYERRLDDLGVIKGLPFMPKNPLASPFIGSWGTFPLIVKVETPTGLMTVYQFE